MTARDFEVLAQFVSKYADAVVYDLMGMLTAAYPTNFNDHKFMARVEELRQIPASVLVHRPSPAAFARRPPGAR